MTLYALNEKQKDWMLRTMGIKPGVPDRGPTFIPENEEIPFRNDSGEIVPERAVMRVSGVVQIGGRDAFSIVKPTTTDGLFAFNNTHEVAVGKRGMCFVGPRVIAKYTGGIVSGSVVGVSGWSLATTGAMLLDAVAYGAIDSGLGMFRVGGNSMGGAFFLTPAGGIPAASSVTTPSFASSQIFRFNGTAIQSFSPPKFEQLGNHIQTAIGGNKMVQAKRINGSWFVDVEPCS